MKPHAKPNLRVLLFAGLTLLLTLPVLAQSGGELDLSWNTVDSGGGTFSSGGGYTLGSTIGQPDAGGMTGGVYTLSGGFWAGQAAPPLPPSYDLFLPLINK